MKIHCDDICRNSPKILHHLQVGFCSRLFLVLFCCFDNIWTIGKSRNRPGSNAQMILKNTVRRRLFVIWVFEGNALVMSTVFFHALVWRHAKIVHSHWPAEAHFSFSLEFFFYLCGLVKFHLLRFYKKNKWCMISSFASRGTLAYIFEHTWGEN